MIKCSQITTLLEENPQYIFTFNPEDENVHEHPIAVANQSKYSISNQKFLQELCQTNSIEKISVFDRYGRILATNNSDWYYVISDDPNSQAYPFWEILAERKDEVAQDLILNDEGDYAQYIGRAFYYYTITNEDGSIRYVTQKDYDSQLAGTWTGGLIQKNRGLVQINIAPERLKTVAGTATLEYVASHMNVYGSGKVIIFDTSENHQCIYSNNDLDLNLSASALGFSGDAFDETGATYSGTTTLNGNEYFQILKYSGGRYTGVLVPTDDVYAKRTYVSLTIFISSLIGIWF